MVLTLHPTVNNFNEETDNRAGLRFGADLVSSDRDS